MNLLGHSLLYLRKPLVLETVEGVEHALVDQVGRRGQQLDRHQGYHLGLE